MQKFEHFARLPRLSAAGKSFCAAVSLLILVAASVRAGEPVMTLAMSEPTANTAVSSMDLPSGKDDSLLNLPAGQSEAAGSAAEKLTVSSGGQIESQTNLGERELPPLVREDSHPSKSVSIQAGCGRIWDDESTLKKIAADHQEPSCAYVSAKFSF